MENEFEKGFMAGFLINQRKSTNEEDSTSEKWTYPSNWLPLSKVRDNEISALVFVQAGYLAKIYVYGNEVEGLKGNIEYIQPFTRKRFDIDG